MLRAAFLVAVDQHTEKQIADECGVSVRTISSWKLDKEFRAEVVAHLERWREDIAKRGPGDDRRVLHRATDRYRRLCAVVKSRRREMLAEQKRIRKANKLLAEARTELPPMGSPGYFELAERIPEDEPEIPPQALMGTMTRKRVSVHVGEKTYDVHWQYEFDAALFAELRALEQQCLTITGKWKTRVEHTGNNGNPIEHDVRHAAEPRHDLRLLGPEKLATLEYWLMEIDPSASWKEPAPASSVIEPSFESCSLEESTSTKSEPNANGGESTGLSSSFPTVDPSDENST